MDGDPRIDGRRRAEFAEHARSIAPGFTDQWSPGEDDVGDALVDLFAEMAEDVAERLDRVPEKQRVSFFDTVGFDRDPPQPAELPVAVEVAEEIGENVRIPAGTQATADATDDRPELVFQTESTFEATPARIASAYSADPERDLLVDHVEDLTAAASETLFSTAPEDQENEQHHALYVAHESRLDLGPGTTLTVDLETHAGRDAIETLEWEYVGEAPEDGADSGNEEPPWQSFEVVSIERRGEEEVTREEAVAGVDRFVAERGEALRESLREAVELHGRSDLLNELLGTVGLETRPASEYESLSLPSVGQLAGLTAIAPDPTRRTGRAASAEPARTDAESSGRSRREVVDVDETLATIEGHQHLGLVASIERFDATGGFEALGVTGEFGGIELLERFEERGVPEAIEELAGVHAVEEPDAIDDDALRAFVGHLLGELAGQPVFEFPEVEPPAYYRVTLRPATAIEETPVGEIETRWIRSRIPAGEAGPELFELQIGPERATSIVLDGAPELGPIRIGSSVEDAAPDALLANDVPLPSSIDGDEASGADGDSGAGRTGADAGEDAIQPFGDWPRLQDAFYVASRDAFTKGGTEATITFEGAPDRDGEDRDGDGNGDGDGTGGGEGNGDGDGDDSPQLSWEYYDGDGWSRLELEAEGTSRLRSDGEVRFEVPDGLEPTTVAGHEGHWIRVRLVGGGYGELTAKRLPSDEEEWTTIRNFDPPTYESIAVSYDDLDAPEHVVAENALAYGPDQIAADRETYSPFRPLPEDGQTLYLGFDAQLRDGPIHLLVDPEDAEYRDTFHPRVRWEYCVDPASDRWQTLDVTDETNGLTERGIVGLVFPEETTAFERFGRERHWIRARVTRDRFEHEEWTAERIATSVSDDIPPPCEAAVETVPPAGPPRRRLPTIERLVPNAAWASNERRIRDELIGSSDGRPNQTMPVSSPPIAEVDVWVDERESLTADHRAALQDSEPERIDVEGPEDQPEAVWVRWIERSDLLESESDDRHYEIDSVTGEIHFGDETRGRIPPPGTDNVRATYTTGGGAVGNVERGAVGGLRRSIEFVEGVTNPIPGDGGADAEPTAAVLERAPKALRDRGRAVTAADVERIAASTSRRLERVRCLPGMDEAGAETPGWVTLLIVPESPAKRPSPSVTLKQQVERAVLDRAPHLVESTGQLAVRGPGYVPVSVETTLVSDGTESVGAVEEAASDALDAFLHPLTGGRDGSGWQFGELPCPSDLYGLLEPLDGVDHVSDLVVRLEGVGGVETVREGDPMPSVSADALVHSGEHDVVGRLGSRTPSAGGG